MRVGRKAKAERVPGQPGGASDRGRDHRALVPVADRRSPLETADPVAGPGRTARRPRLRDRRRDRPGRHRAVRDRCGHRGDPDRHSRPARRRPATRTARHGWSSGSRSCSTPPATSGPRRPCARSGIRFATWPITGSRARSTNRGGSTSRGSSSGRAGVSRWTRSGSRRLWPIFHQGVRHTKDVQCWAEWWILWRRVAAGLTRPHHEEIYRRLAPFLLPVKGSTPGEEGRAAQARAARAGRDVALRRQPGAPGARPQRIVGDALLKERTPPPGWATALWCLGRLGARVPLYGLANTVVHGEIGRALDSNPCSAGRSRRVARPARRSSHSLNWHESPDDRARDIDDDLRGEVLKQLADLGADEIATRPVREYHELESSQEVQALGDSLPIGLRLLSDADAGAVSARA